MTKLDEKKMPDQNKKRHVKNVDHPLFLCYTLFQSKIRVSNPTNPSFESTGKKSNLWDGYK